MLPIEAKTETMPAALEVDWISGTESRPTVALYFNRHGSTRVDRGPHIIYSRQEHRSLSDPASTFINGRRKIQQSYNEEKVLIFLDNAAGILIPDFLHSTESPMILTHSFDVF